MVTKKRPKDSSTNWAQGGVAAILDKTNVEGMESHVQDTLRSGDGACDEAVVRSIISEAGDRIMDLIRIGVEFEKGRTERIRSFVKEAIPQNASFTPRTPRAKRLNARSPPMPATTRRSPSDPTPSPSI